MATPNQTSGLIFPLELSSGRHLISSSEDLIKSSIKILISWPLFTRDFEGDFGSRIYELIEEPNDDIVINLVRRFVLDSISTWEKRVDLIGLNVTRPTNESLAIDLSYKIRELNLVDTFYYNYPLN
jgi:phage baseplate assembly protein W